MISHSLSSWLSFFLFTSFLFSLQGEIFGYIGNNHVILSSTSRYDKSGSSSVSEYYPWLRKCNRDCIIGFHGDGSDCEYLYEKIYEFIKTNEPDGDKEVARGEHERTLNPSVIAVSYTHLTLPTTPYV